MKRVLSVLFFLVVNCIGYSLNFKLYPTSFNLDINKTSVNEVTIINETLNPLRVTIYPEKDIEFGEDYNLNNNITIVPKNISLKPGGSQVVRFRIKPDATRKVGEFRSYLTFKEILPEIKTTATTNADGLMSNIQFITELSIPVSASGDSLVVDGSVKNVKLKYNGGNSILTATLTSKGNTAMRLNYDLEVIGKNIKRTGSIGSSKREGVSELKTPIELGKKLDGSKVKLIIKDQNGKEYYNNTLILQ
ncbi:molecular chaperone [Fusobacterium mortiferum]|jgi:P pilus assembly chaperone PapD|uniref:Molecular chaperone n=1 Tax=Candidatus Fusobacterium pullicola TaxID=2838601 RepID=A0A9E2KWM9_9FUSO|nr:molecular chaperone [Fusobacterium mortiferum]MBM6822981.1 molecular chaperone [Fusobacterium mortiferum]MBU3841832.1 molecular chaperone [Candidatus Fusobacterium pullicola]